MMATAEVFTPERVQSLFSNVAPGGPYRNRTCDQRIKSPLLYLTELTAQQEKLK